MSGRTPKVIVALAVLAGAVAPLLATSASRAVPRVTVPHYTIYEYNVKVGVKGGDTETNTFSGSYNGDMVQETASASYSIDGTIHSLGFFTGALPKGLGSSANGSGTAVVNGSWTDQGTRWVDVTNNVTAPFTCSGTVNLAVQPGQMGLSWKRAGSKLKFTLATVQSELQEVGNESCPPDSATDWLQGTDPIVYMTQFSLPVSAIGRKAISVQASGPLAQNRKFFLENCPEGTGSSCNLTWQGTVRFTRGRVMKLG
jgi:hypothetical protein